MKNVEKVRKKISLPLPISIISILAIFFILMGIIFFILMGIFYSPSSQNETSFCIFAEPQYLLLCDLNATQQTILNETKVAVNANFTTLQPLLEKNPSCKIVAENDNLDIGYCYQNASIKYKLSTEKINGMD